MLIVSTLSKSGDKLIADLPSKGLIEQLIAKRVIGGHEPGLPETIYFYEDQSDRQLKLWKQINYLYSLIKHPNTQMNNN